MIYQSQCTLDQNIQEDTALEASDKYVNPTLIQFGAMLTHKSNVGVHEK